MLTSSKQSAERNIFYDHDVTIGDEVELIASHYKSLRGIVRFIGEIRSLRHSTDKYFGNVFYGIELYQNNKGNDGSIYGERFFSCKPGHGLFVKRNKIYKIITINYDVARITINDTIYIPKYKCNGIIRYIGIPDFEYNSYINPQIFYGIELNQPYGDNNGIINKRYYFDYCRDDHGIFMNELEMSYLKQSSRNNLLVHGYSDNYNINIPNGICKLIKSYIDDIYFELASFQYETNGYNSNKKTIIKRKKRFEVHDIAGNLVGPSLFVYDENRNYGIHTTEIDRIYRFTQTVTYMTHHRVAGTSNKIEQFNNDKWMKIEKSTTMSLDELKQKKKDIFNDIVDKYKTTHHELKKAMKDNGISFYGLILDEEQKK